MTPEQEQSISLALVKWKPDNIDKTFIRLTITSAKTGTLEAQVTEARFHQILAELDMTGSFHSTRELTELHLDGDYDT